MKKFLIVEKIFTVCALLHYDAVPLVLLLSNGVSEGEDDTSVDLAGINQVFLVIYFITFCLLLLRWKKVLPVIAKGGIFWLLFGLIAASFFWSYSPELTRTRIVAFSGTMLFSIYLASRYTLKEQLHLLGWMFGIAVVSSIIFGILLPKYGQMGGFHAGAWRGIYNHKNGLGKNMVISAVMFCLLALSAQKRRWILWSFVGASAMLIILSHSTSSILNLLISLVIIAILPIFGWNYLFVVPILIAISAIGTILYLFLTMNVEQAVSALGKDLTLTGRTNFWPLVFDKILERPWLGYGFGAFWQGLDGPSAYVWNASAFKAPNSHNGYLDLCAELGFVGFSVYTTAFITSFQQALTNIRRIGTPDTFWPISMFVAVVLSNLTESALVVQNNFLWVMQVSIFFSISLPQVVKERNLFINKA
ncbi:O-antigen ligase [Chamaesiphon sp. GL140_3_metabinner_50]|uniref:O-antigen ligase family protein n=1 Tax=Chamaesiphon sp. GL140_3_metabinner_50 TaxID=2970812 RepID=UPI0025FE2E18|nr:O-antigen ligase [Chamaesiphon sp. GL140_3_metabinner_50]